MPDGTTAAARATQLSFESEETNIVIKVDFRNAFNTISRTAVLTQLFDRPELGSFFRFAQWAYSKPSVLLVRNSTGEVITSLDSAEGVRQGCVLGPLLFATATLQLLTDLKEKFPNCEIIAYLDDVAISGPAAQALQAFNDLSSGAADLGLFVQPDKCTILLPDAPIAVLPPDNFRTVRGALPFLGSAVGKDEAALSQWVSDTVLSWTRPLSLVSRKELHAQLSLLIARWMMVAKPNSLARALPPHLTQGPLSEYGDQIIRAIEARFDLSFVGFSREVVQLSTRYGGLGFCPAAETAPHAFVAGMAASLSGVIPFTNLKKRLPWNEHSTLPSFRCLQENLHRLYSPASQLEFDGVKKMRNLDDFAPHFCYSKNSTKLQARIMLAVRILRSDRVEATAEPAQLATLLCRSNKNSASIWRAYPLTRDFKLTDDETKFLVAYTTRAPLPYLPDNCTCGAPLDLDHALHCGPTKLIRHNMMQSRLAAFAREQGVPIRQNARLTIEDARTLQQPDIVFYNLAFSSRPLETDITIVNPCSAGRVDMTVRNTRATLTRARNDKNRKYKQRAIARGHDFEPLPFETHGLMGDEIKMLLLKIAGNTPDRQGYATSDMALDLAVTLVRGNHLCARTTIARAMRHRDEMRARSARLLFFENCHCLKAETVEF
jgi:Reverse transcriptase (RNA-dependent DNA polymerase)